jgi:alpha-1,6-mannosyltransferase
VSWLPYQTDRSVLAKLYSAADAYVSPCPTETFGLSALEAMAAGVPVLSADGGGVSELVRRSGGGLLFASGSAEACAAGLSELLSGQGSALGARGRDYAVREHAWDTVFARLVAVYRDVIGR